MHVPQYDVLYVISDLHMGGKSKDRQIFHQGDRLSAFIDSLAGNSDVENKALVINGDVVDFIAEPNPEYFDTRRPLERLQRIAADDSFRPVFESLARFVRTPGCHLVLVLGNHDVELALPEVRYWLIEELTGGDDAARGRLTTVFDGTGFSCQVGEKTVLCVHGNEVDPWNVIDYRLLLFVSRELNRLQAPRLWDACAGTHLVVDVMNDIKKDFPFVDLLKPEVEATLAILLTMVKDPFQFGRLGKAATIVKKLKRDTRRLEDQLLSGDIPEGAENVQLSDPTGQSDDLAAIEQFVAEHFGDVKNQGGADVEDDLFGDVYRDLEAGRSPLESDSAEDEELLGKPALFMNRVLERFGLVTEADKIEKLRLELRAALESDRSFDLSHRGAGYDALDALAGTGIDYLISGHTHLARAYPRKTGDAKSGYYYNSGTWVRLMELPRNLVNDPQGFAKIYQDFKVRPLTELDKVQVTGDNNAQTDELDFDDPSTVANSSPRQLVKSRPFVVTIHKDQQQRVFGELRRVSQDGSLRPIPGTRFP